MAERSLKASQDGIARAENALTDKGWSRQDLAEQVVIEGKKTTIGIDIQTIHKFLTAKKVDRKYFVGICKSLELSWQDIVEHSEITNISTFDSNSSRGNPPVVAPNPDGVGTGALPLQNIDVLVQEVRQQIQPYIQERCGTMRVLDMSQPIGLGEIYTSVNILEKITGRRGLELTALMRDADPEKFDRFCLGNVRERRVPGLKAVETFSKLMILGKPGAGKTTFLKHLAIQCIGGKFQGDRVPIFITLKDFAEADGKPDVLEYINRLVAIPDVGANGGSPIPMILRSGKTLILLDGLDEVKDTDSSRVLREIRDFSQQFPQNQFVITCRIAAREYTFEKFTELEIADFDDEQIADFSSKWFHSKNDPIKAKSFLQKLQEDAPIRELATNPLLLTLLCLVFEDSGSFPTNRAELYQNGIDVLLKKWDVNRNIEREQVYKRLSLKRKEDLLSHIALSTFEAGNYFFKQREVERYISQYIQNLPDASTDPQALELDSAAVLKSIEAQHGLFVARARGIYSFSHLTFHEYFTARKMVMSCNPYTTDDSMLQGLVSHLTEKRWREVFLLTIGTLDSADALLRLMKAQIDSLMAEDEKVQQFLDRIDQKARLVETPYRLASARAFYFSLAQARICSRSLFVDQNLACAIEPALISTSIFISNHALDISNHELDKLYAIDCALIRALNLAVSNPVALVCPIYPKEALDKEPRLKCEFQKLVDALPDLSYGNIKNFSEWWQKNGKAWTEQLRALMIEHRNIGHDWQFSEEQKAKLKQYYDANKLLVDCLNSDCYVSRQVRQEIEDTLLLPIAEIKKRQQQTL